MLNLEGIPGCKGTPEDVCKREVPGCKVTPEDVAKRESIMQNYPRKIMTNCCLHASDLQLTNWQGQENGDITQVLDPGVDEKDDYFVDTQLVNSQEWTFQWVM